ncbi:coiled-coil domain-containing protein 103 [Salmo salar]|uniref:Coiled-coil domain-containing protein 103 n=1 Tax=Salmo salar TaxID=8030 RepID=A0ABM3EWM9_SALSA|nr:coiled-coil domain-containing protein 103-like [Salmo salar]
MDIGSTTHKKASQHQWPPVPIIHLLTICDLQCTSALPTGSRIDDSPEVINFSALERELQSAVEADNKYQRENDAKFRALHQKVGTYEAFRDIVLASHLKPLDRKDKAEAPCKQPWNALASADKGQNQTSCDEIGLKPQLSEFQDSVRVQPGLAQVRQ